MFGNRAKRNLAAEDVAAIYRALLGRLPTDAEVEIQREAFQTWPELLDAVVASAEHQARLLQEAEPSTPPAPVVNIWHPDLAPYGHAVGTRSEDGSVVMGREGWVFLVTGSNSVLDQYGADFAVEDGWHERWAEVVHTRQDGARSLGADLAMVVVPDKLSVMAGFLPPEVELVAAPPARHLVADFPRVRYPVERLRQATGDSFLRTDTHLADHGNTALAEVVLADLRVAPARLAESGAASSYLTSGDLGGRFEPPAVEVVTGVGSFGRARVVEDNRPRVAALGRHVGTRRVFRNEDSTDPRTVVVFGDSYAFSEPHYHGISWHLAQVFREVHFVWAPFGWDPDYVQHVGATAVVCEMAERFVPRPPDDRVVVEELVTAALAP